MNPGRIGENSDVSTLPEDDMRQINEGITSRIRFNAVVKTGVPGVHSEAKVIFDCRRRPSPSPRVGFRF
jgi:hypothetical protein